MSSFKDAYPTIVYDKGISKYKSAKEQEIAQHAYQDDPPTNQLDSVRKFYNNGKFDDAAFVNAFRAKQNEDSLLQKIQEEEKLQALADADDAQKKKLLDFTVYEHLLGLRDTFFGVIEDTLTLNVDRTILTKEHRLFYIGIFCLIIVIMYALLISLNN